MTCDGAGSRPSHRMIIPNTKRHPNNTKRDQLHIFEVITGLPRLYRNTRYMLMTVCIPVHLQQSYVGNGICVAHTVMMRVNTPRGGTILQVEKVEKLRPGAFTKIPGRFLNKDFRDFGPPGRCEKTRKKAHTYLLYAGRYKKSRKKAHTSHTHAATAR